MRTMDKQNPQECEEEDNDDIVERVEKDEIEGTGEEEEIDKSILGTSKENIDHNMLEGGGRKEEAKLANAAS